MADLPPVVCPSCGASYRHPGRAGRTKCKSCGEPLVITLPGEAPAAAAEPAPVGPKPPAVKPKAAPGRPAPPKVAPAGRPRPPVVDPAAEAAGAEPDASPGDPGTVRRERSRPGARARRPTTGGASRRRAAEPEAPSRPAPRRGSRGSSRRAVTTSGRPTTVVIPEDQIPVPRRKGPNPAVLIACAVGAVVLLGGGLWWALSGEDPPKDTGKTPAKTASTGTGSRSPSASEKDPGDGIDSLVPVGDKTVTEPDPGETGTGGTGEPAGGAGEAATKEPAKTPEPEKTPASKYEKRWNDLEPFELVSGTTSDQESEIKGLIAEAIDLDAGAASYRAYDKIVAKGKVAIPLVLNEYLKVDVDGSRDEILKGKTLNGILIDITKVPDRVYDPTEGGVESGYYRSLVRYFWHRWWKKEKDTWTGPKMPDEDENG